MDAQRSGALEQSIGQIFHTIRVVGVPGIIDHRLGNHGLHQGLSNGWLAAVWLACVCCTGDCRKSGVKKWVGNNQQVLERLLNKRVRPGEFSDGRMGALLRRLSDTSAWCAMEADMHEAAEPHPNGDVAKVRLRVTNLYSCPNGGDARVPHPPSPSHAGEKDGAERPVARLVAAITEPGGHLLACDVHPKGAFPARPASVPVARVREMLSKAGLLYACEGLVADMRTRADIIAHGDHYLSPIPFHGSAAKTIDACIQDAMEGRGPVQAYRSTGASAGIAFEFSRRLSIEVDGNPVSWMERVQVLRSAAVAHREMQSLNQELERAQEELLHLTDVGGRGKRPFTEESALAGAVSRVLAGHGVTDLLQVVWVREEECSRHYVGRGRGGPNRPVRTDTRARYAITRVSPDVEAIRRARYRLGWHVQGTSLPVERFPLRQALALHVEEQDGGGAGQLGMELMPLTVRRDDQVVGLARLLVLAQRLDASVQCELPHPPLPTTPLVRPPASHPDLSCQAAG